MSFGSHRASFHQRRIALIGFSALVGVFVVGAPRYVDRVESDLETKVTAALVEAGFAGVSVSFDGQTGSLRCVEPIARPSEVLAVASSVRGVRSIEELPVGCRLIVSDGDGGADEASGSTTSTTGGADATTSVEDESIFATVLDVLAANPQFSLLSQLARDSDVATVLIGDDPVTMFAPTDAAFDALAPDVVAQLRSDRTLLAEVLRHHLAPGLWPAAGLPVEGVATLDGDLLTIDRSGGTTGAITVAGVPLVAVDVVAGNGIVHTIDRVLVPADVDLEPVVVPSTSATFDGEGFVLGGVVRSEAERSTILTAASAVVDRVDDQLIVDPELGLDELAAGDFADLTRAVGRHLLSGTVGFYGKSFTVTGVAAGGPQRAAFEQDVSGIDAAITLTIAPPVSDDDASALEDELNDLVAADLIRFGTGSTRIDAGSQAVLEAIVRSLSRFDGVRVTVEGHTDSDGVPEDNVTLSRLRAESVREALIGLGLDPTLIEARGYGSERPVLVDGAEDKDASRRVEFRVVVS